MGVKLGSFTLKYRCGLRVFENRVQRSVFGPQRDEVTGVERITL